MKVPTTTSDEGLFVTICSNFISINTHNGAIKHIYEWVAKFSLCRHDTTTMEVFY